MCTHDWQPIPNWYARYRCSLCQAIGCKFGVVVARHQTRSAAIAPYRCEARIGGERCNEPAVHSWNGKKYRCPAHRRPGHTTRARLTQSTGVDPESTAIDARSTARDSESGGRDSPP